MMSPKLYERVQRSSSRLFDEKTAIKSGTIAVILNAATITA